MIIALLALAFAMIGGGLLATFYGWDIVLVERGWTMVIAGSIAAASGALLLGITAAVSRLGRIRAELARLQEGSLREAPFALPAAADVSPVILPGDLPGAEEPGRADAGKRGEQAEPPAFPAGESGREEKAEEPAEARPVAAVLPFPLGNAPAPAAEDASGVKIPDFLRADRFRDADEETRTSEAEDSPYAAEPVSEGQGLDARGDVLEPAVWPEPELEAEPAAGTEAEAEDEGVAEEPPGPATIVGTYNSGDNKYVMYSDGSIEAQTPRGVFRFKSLDELKEFIAAGGEGNSAVST